MNDQKLRSGGSEPAYDNPVGDKGGNVLADEKKDKGRPSGSRHTGVETEGQHDQRPKQRPTGHPSDKKLGRKPPVG